LAQVKQAVLAALAALLAFGCSERDRTVGVIEGSGRAAPIEDPAGRSDDGRRILFGDLHAHTTYSIDAFIYSLPLFGGEGAHPPADACDYARYCSALDFFSITDHAEGITPDRWQRIKDSTRECNARAGDPADPDLVSFIGWEWTQAGPTPESHYGHKNVIFPELGDEAVPARTINSLPPGTMTRAAPPLLMKAGADLLGLFGQSEYADFLWFIGKMAETPECEPGVDVRALPLECMENAPTPAVLFEKLDQWGFESLVIPHGLAWGAHAPPGSKLDVQLNPRDHDSERQTLVEVYSGHGNSEEFRSFRAHGVAEDGQLVCREPTNDFLPCCWRAGEIVRERCDDLPEEECEARVLEAQRLVLEAGRNPRRVLPDTTPEDWLDCDQCRDCFKPAYSLRPRQSAQYALAIGNFDERAPDGDALRYRWGFIGSSDDHKAQPGTGYKQIYRRKNSDARGLATPGLEERLMPFALGEQKDPQRAQAAPPATERGFKELFDVERVASFLYPGGLVAVHAAGRDRRSIWEALRRREVYGTSGPRILLWFDLLNAPEGKVPMGGGATLSEAPQFEVRAVGAQVQQPGCPDASLEGLTRERLERLCRGECHNPGDKRHPIVAIEVVRIRPQQHEGEDVATLIEDPWRRFPCEPDPSGCRVRFEDPDFVASDRPASYYVRALHEATPAVNGANLRAVRDARGTVVSTEPCYGGYKTDADDDCLALVQERAFSSPIFLEPR
jgi:hypothetical protein